METGHASSALRGLSLDGTTVNARVKAAKYAVRGNVMDRSMELQRRMAAGEKLPFEEIVPCNIGNPHACLQAPLSFHREVLSLCISTRRSASMICRFAMKLDYFESSPGLTEHTDMFKSDVISRAKNYLAGTTGGVGAYSNSQGLRAVREEVAAFITERDGHPSYPERIFLTNGASEGVRMVLTCMLRGPGHNDGLLTPIPQYPLYSASLTLLGGALVPYYLNESGNWGVEMQNLRQALDSARSDGTVVRGIAVINPGNPTGNILSEGQIRDIIQMAADEKLLILADEVYQANVWKEGASFSSFKKVACNMGFTGEDGDERLQLVSFHSTSKGFLGECGLRGGYMELHGLGAEANFSEDNLAMNFSTSDNGLSIMIPYSPLDSADDVRYRPYTHVLQRVRAELYKLCSLSLCSNVTGQLATGLMVNPPRQGDPSYEIYQKERGDILSSLLRRSRMVHQALNELEGVTCNEADGALYAFPRIRVSKKTQKVAESNGLPADEYYCLKILDETGIILVPGSGFGQEEGTLHFRTTFLPAEETMNDTLKRLAKAHAAFMDEHRD